MKINDKQMIKIIPLCLIVFTMTLMNVGCIPQNRKGKVWQPVKKTKTPFVHLVKWPEEALPIIAKWYTGDSKNWKSIANANPSINPRHLSVGNKIFIPEDLLKTRDPVLREFVTEYYAKKKKTATSTKKIMPFPKQEDKFEIFGPK